jgi:hypothetical protein
MEKMAIWTDREPMTIPFWIKLVEILYSGS